MATIETVNPIKYASYVVETKNIEKSSTLAPPANPLAAPPETRGSEVNQAIVQMALAMPTNDGIYTIGGTSMKTPAKNVRPVAMYGLSQWGF